jgi:hypothetical protein
MLSGYQSAKSFTKPETKGDTHEKNNLKRVKVTAIVPFLYECLQGYLCD